MNRIKMFISMRYLPLYYGDIICYIFWHNFSQATELTKSVETPLSRCPQLPARSG